MSRKRRAFLAATMLVLAGCGTNTASEATADSSDAAEGEIAVTATSLSFDPKDIRVEAGEDFTIRLTSQDSAHDFTIDELDVHVHAEAGATITRRLRAEEPSRYTFYCSVAGHRQAGMEGTLIVQG